MYLNGISNVKLSIKKYFKLSNEILKTKNFNEISPINSQSFIVLRSKKLMKI